MHEGSVGAVRCIYDAWNEGDPGLRHFDPGVELQQASGFMGSGRTFRGHEGVVDSGRELLADLRDLRWEPHDFIPAPGGRVVVPFSAHATGRRSQVPVEMRLAHVWTIQGGLAIRMLTYEDLGQALGAVGLTE